MKENKTIMIVDDTESNIDILVELLGEDYEIMVAMNGNDCLETVEMQIPDIFLLDVMMPGMDGYELCRKLKSQKQTRDIPVIFVTAKGAIEDKLDGYNAGGIDYITKPIDPKFTLETIKKHLIS